MKVKIFFVIVVVGMFVFLIGVLVIVLIIIDCVVVECSVFEYLCGVECCGIEGFVMVFYVIDVDGSVVDVQIVEFMLAGVFDCVVLVVIEIWCYEVSEVCIEGYIYFLDFCFGQ